NTSYTGNVTIAMASNPGNATLGGTLTLGLVGGVATFSGLSITTAAAGYTIGATDGTFSTNTAAFKVKAAVGTQLVMIAQPPSTVGVGQGFGLTVAVEDKYGNIVTSFGGTLTVALASNPGGATLGGTLTVAIVNGEATFSGLTLNKPGNGYTLNIL